MKPPYPLGRRESQELEFEAATASNEKVARELVAMLNASGGELWLGVREEDGVAASFEHVADVDRRWGSLLDDLLSKIEPAPTNEVTRRIEHVAAGDVLVIRVQPARRPYALKKREGGRQYLLRVDDRILPMNDDQIRAAYASRPPQGRDAPDSAHEASALDERRAVRLEASPDRLWVASLALPPPDLDVQDERLQQLLTDPSSSGSRRSGRTFGWPGRKPALKRDALELGELDLRWTRIQQDGLLEFSVPARHLAGLAKEPDELDGTGILEYVIAFVRLSAAVYRPFEVERVLFDLALSGADRYHLPAYPPGTYGHGLVHERPPAYGDAAYVRTSPLAVAAQELDANPDRVGFRLVRALYQAYGLPEDRIPAAYDRKLERLTLTD